MLPLTPYLHKQGPPRPGMLAMPNPKDTVTGCASVVRAAALVHCPHCNQVGCCTGEGENGGGGMGGGEWGLGGGSLFAIFVHAGWSSSHLEVTWWVLDLYSSVA